MTKRQNFTCKAEDCCNFIRPGSKRKFCDPSCRDRDNKIRISKTTCRADGCWKNTRTLSGDYCESHYIAKYRSDGPKRQSGPRTRTCPVCSNKFSKVGLWFCSIKCEVTFDLNPTGESKPCCICEGPIWRAKSYPGREVCWESRCISLRARLRNYGIDIAQYKEYIASYGESCWVCGDERDPLIDHCHETGKFRGLLCHKHNSALGLFGDSVDGLNRAVEYLKRFG